MKSIERQRFLMTKANKHNFVSIPDSARELKVSIETIRRDINILCEQKKLKKVHGGAVPLHAAVKKTRRFFCAFSAILRERLLSPRRLPSWSMTEMW